MHVINSLLDWCRSNQAALWWIGAVSAAALVLTPIIVGMTLVRLPSDYFARQHPRPLESLKDRPALRYALLAAKNAAGVLLLVAGVAMLLLPGQGLLTIAVGLVLIDFPGKIRLERWLVTRRSVWRSIGWLRKRAKCEPLRPPGQATQA